jgi:hypothetical protein
MRKRCKFENRGRMKNENKPIDYMPLLLTRDAPVGADIQGVLRIDSTTGNP